VSVGPPARRLLEEGFRAALGAVHGGRCVRRALDPARGAEGPGVDGRPLPSGARVVVAAVGKAAVPMAVAAEDLLGPRLRAGRVVTRDALAPRPERLPVEEAGHPVPDARSEAAGRGLLALAEQTRREDVLLVLLSGGASALLATPLPGLDGAQLAETTRCLLEGGADIGELNAVRKHLTAVSGGRLARCAGAGRVEVLALSDVPGDDFAVLGSGPCAPDPTTFADALAVLERRDPVGRAPEAVRRFLARGRDGLEPETPKPGDPLFGRVHHTCVGSNADARRAAVAAVRRRGLPAEDLGPVLSGEARTGARELLAAASGRRGPLLLVAGGETAVTVRGPGRGGRSQELALAAAIALRPRPGLHLLAAGTDGSDGPTDAAGAFADAGTVDRGARRGRDAGRDLEANDSHSFFAAEGGLLRTGPTGTNVMDLALLWIDAGCQA